MIYQKYGHLRHRVGAIMYALVATIGLVDRGALAFAPPSGEPPKAIHVAAAPIIFPDPSFQGLYNKRCGTELYGVAKFVDASSSANAALSRFEAKGVGRSQFRAAREAVFQAILAHREARDDLFECLSLLEKVASNADAANASVANMAIKLHGGTLTTIDGHMIQLLTRLERFTF